MARAHGGDEAAKTVKVTVTVPTDVLDEIDSDTDNRSAFVTAALRVQLGRRLLVDLVTAADRVVEILPLLAADTVEAARIEGVLDLTGIGDAIIAARDHDAILATYQVTAAVRTLPDDQVLDLGFAGE